HTVTFIKVKGTEEIIGGYNPLIWKGPLINYEWGITKDSFIFSFKSKDDFKDPILSYVKDMNQAVLYFYTCGPNFGDCDIEIYSNNDNSKEYNFIRCKQLNYEKKIRSTDQQFLIEDYEEKQLIASNSDDAIEWIFSSTFKDICLIEGEFGTALRAN
ncbi:hypothetical protein C1645_829829, partial [Glomus cerebriforme]